MLNKKFTLLGILLLVIILLAMGFCSLWVSVVTKNKTFNTIKETPSRDVAMVLGTSKLLKSGVLNPYFVYRIEAAAELYHAGKIKRIVVSGDHSLNHYNESQDMMNALVDKEVSPQHIYLDYAGLRTLDSVVRIREIFGQNKIIVISQEFHNKRAIFIGNYRDVDIIGYNAKDVGVTIGLKVQIREQFARVKAVVDVLFNKQPKYLGDPIEIIL